MQRYINRAWLPSTDQNIVSLLTEGCGIRSISRLLKIAVGTVINRIKLIAKALVKPSLFAGSVYEVDELRTFTGNKKTICWVIIALERSTGLVVDVKVGQRNKVNLRSITDPLVNSGSKAIFTDKLPVYRTIIPASLHKTERYGTNKIERMNLCLRTHLKRLSRKSICYAKCPKMIAACVGIYLCRTKIISPSNLCFSSF